MSFSSVSVVSNALRLKFLHLSGREENKMERKIIIEGMMCGHCKATVEKALSGIEEVKSFSVNLEEKKCSS